MYHMFAMELCFNLFPLYLTPKNASKFLLFNCPCSQM